MASGHELAASSSSTTTPPSASFTGLITAAVEALAVASPDVIVLDRHLPDGDGFHALQSLRLTCTRACVPVVAFTASYEDAARDVALSAGCTTFVRKPSPPAVLVRHVWNALGSPSSRPLRDADG